jgi:hypothetical protein
LTKNDHKHRYYANNFPILTFLIIENSHRNTFRTNNDSISSKFIAKQQVVTQHKVIPGSNFDQIGKLLAYLGSFLVRIWVFDPLW